MQRLRGEPHPDSRAMLQEIELELGCVPPTLEFLALEPRALEAVWHPLSITLIESGRIARTTKELGALAALSAARVTGLRDVIRAGLERRGLGRPVLDDVQHDGETRRLPERTREVIAYLRRTTLQPNLLVDGDVTQLRRVGMEEEDLAELIATAAALAGLIAAARALGQAER